MDSLLGFLSVEDESLQASQEMGLMMTMMLINPQHTNIYTYVIRRSSNDHKLIRQMRVNGHRNTSVNLGLGAYR